MERLKPFVLRLRLPADRPMGAGVPTIVFAGFFIRYHGFRGGLHLPPAAFAMPAPEVVHVPAPETVRVPLGLIGDRMHPCVVAGESVRAGQAIARDERDVSTVVRASISGTVTGLVRVDIAGAMDVPAVEIRGGDVSGTVSGEKEPDFRPLAEGEWTLDDLIGAAAEAGLLDRAAPQRSLAAWLRAAAQVKADTLIINALNLEPWLPWNDRLVAQAAEPVLHAAEWLKAALKLKRVWLAVERGGNASRAVSRKAAARAGVRVVSLPNRYPQGSSPLLVYSLTRRCVPPGGSPLDIGVVVLEAATCAALFDTARHGRAVTHQVVTVTGPAAHRAGHYRVPIGTRYEWLVTAVGLRRPLARVVEGGALTGRPVASLDQVVSQATTAVLLFDAASSEPASPGPCIRCGWCHDLCPADLDPLAMLDAHDLGQNRGTAVLMSLACIECGLCSYVCPSKLPLAHAAGELRRRLVVDGRSVEESAN